MPWRYLPHDCPPFQTVYAYFARWGHDGVFARLTGLLRAWSVNGKGTGPSPVRASLRRFCGP
ncbi:transposase [Actinomadura gamaensis]|uniref:Transposase n=1 Tax=Actinomadura gamaensis TaxID=1763541 RepID=A0ABV9U198_9ACTN